MGNYKNGIETKELLYTSAKKIFYQKGYDKTTVKDIITDAKTKQGLLNYYFSSKEMLAVQIYRDFSNDVVFVVDAYFEETKDTRPQGITLDMIGYRSYFKALTSDPQMTHFYTELSKLPLFSKTLFDMREYFFNIELESEKFVNYNPRLKDKTYFNYLQSLTAGMEIQLFRDVLEKRVPLEIPTAIDWFFSEYYGYLFTDKNYIDDCINKSREMVEHFEFTLTETMEIHLDYK